jgi:hypothetical protein
VTHPIPFRKAFWLFFRSSSPRVSVKPEVLRVLGISEIAATTCILIGMFASVAITLGLAWLFVRPLVNLSVFLFGILFVFVFVFVQGVITYAVYRIWHRRCYPAA